jgi:hypothetical protein
MGVGREKEEVESVKNVNFWTWGGLLVVDIAELINFAAIHTSPNLNVLVGSSFGAWSWRLADIMAEC